MSDEITNTGHRDTTDYEALIAAASAAPRRTWPTYPGTD